MIRILILSLFPVFVLANPSWLYSLEKTHKNEIIGYGIDKNQHQAKQSAMADIVKSISVNVKSDTKITKENQKGKYNKDISTNLETSSEAKLTGLIFTKVEQLNGLWYVSAKYDNSPLELKIKKLLSKNLQNQTQNMYLRNTPLFHSLNKEISKKLNYEIIRKDNLWQIKYTDILLPISENNFYNLFVNYKTNDISLIANQKIYNDNDKMYFNINHKKAGYISILYVEHNGKVGILIDNKKSNKSFSYPDLKSKDNFTIVNPYNKPIKELYIALYSVNKIDLSEFENVTDDLLDDSNFNFGKLIKKFNKYSFSTFSIKIK